MKREYTISSSSLLELIRKQGSSEVSRPAFYLICTVVLVCSVTVASLICSMGVRFIEDNFSVGSWVFALVLLSVFNGWVFFHMIDLSLTLWKMTKEEESER